MKTQIKNLRFFGLLLAGLFTIALTSCNKEAVEEIDIESLTERSIEGMHKGAIGKAYCLEFIFPISLQFADESIIEVEDYTDLKESVKAWFDENEVEKSKENKPQLVFPIQVVNQEGEVVDVADEDALKELKSECPKKGKGKGMKGKGSKCFSLVFPLSLTIDGTVEEFEDRASLKTAVKAYKEASGDDFERPTLVFPVTVQLEDESEVVVNSQEELIALKESCK